MMIQSIGKEYGFNKKNMKKLKEITPEIELQKVEFGEIENQVTIHIENGIHQYVRIWNSVELIDSVSNTNAKLVQVYGAPMFPDWKFIPKGKKYTLVFEGLRKSCKQFDLIENIPQSGGFIVHGIERNNLDVYKIIL